MKTTIRVPILATLLVALAAACTTSKPSAAPSPSPSPKPVVRITHRPSPTPSQATAAAARTALAEDGVIQCQKQPGASGVCNTEDPNPQISQGYPQWGFAGPTLDNYSGTYFKRSSPTTADWAAVWAAGPGPFSCGGSYPVPTAVLRDMGGCY